MSDFVTKVIEEHRCDTEKEAQDCINDAKNCNLSILTKYTNEYKLTKDDEYWLVKLYKTFDDVKDPSGSVKIIYQNGAF